ncbi:cytochrome b/b6 domain-containing protein, partial [Agromyces binzhouensis]
MAAAGNLRRGLPRRPGGDPWPPAGIAAGDHATGSVDALQDSAAPATAPAMPVVAPSEPSAHPPQVAT